MNLRLVLSATIIHLSVCSILLRGQTAQLQEQACCELLITVDPADAPVGKDVVLRLRLRNISTNRDIQLLETSILRNYQIEIKDEAGQAVAYTDFGKAMEEDSRSKPAFTVRTNHKTIRPMAETRNQIELNVFFKLDRPGRYKAHAEFVFPREGTFRNVTTDLPNVSSNTIEFVIR